MTSLQVLYTVYAISISLFIVSGLMTLAIIIPLQLLQAQVKNGLAKLRKQMLWIGYYMEAICIGCAFALTSRFFITNSDLNRYIITFLVLMVAVCLTAIVYLFIRIYNQNYNEENKALHAKFEKSERRGVSTK